MKGCENLSAGSYMLSAALYLYYFTLYWIPPRDVRCPTMRSKTYYALGTVVSASVSANAAGVAASPGPRGIFVTRSILT